jgi:MFS family permease
MAKPLSSQRVFGSFMLLALLGGSTMGMTDIAVNLYSIHLGATSPQLGLIKGLQGLGVLAMVLPAGFMIDSFGAAMMFAFGSIIVGGVNLAFPLVGAARWIPVLTAVLGLGVSFRMTSLNSVFLTHIGAVGNGKAGWIRASHALGYALLSPLGMGRLIQRFDFRISFGLISVLSLVAIGFAASVFGQQPASGVASAPDVRLTPKNIASSILALARDRKLVNASLAEALNAGSLSCFVTFIVAYALRGLGVDQVSALRLVALEGATFIVTLFGGGALIGRIPLRQLYLGSYTLVAVALALAGSGRGLAVLQAGAALLGAGVGMISVLNLAQVASVNAMKGRVAGVFTLCASAGMTLGPVLGGLACDRFGFQRMFLALVVPFVAAALGQYRSESAIGENLQ